MRTQIRRYIGERREEGFSDRQIRQKCIDGGYDASLVDACLKECEGQESGDAQQKPLPGWIGWFILSLFLAAVVLLLRRLGWF